MFTSTEESLHVHAFIFIVFLISFSMNREKDLNTLAGDRH